MTDVMKSDFFYMWSNFKFPNMTTWKNLIFLFIKCVMWRLCHTYVIQPIDPTSLLAVDDEDCPSVGGQGDDQDGKVGNGERQGKTVHNH